VTDFEDRFHNPSVPDPARPEDLTVISAALQHVQQAIQQARAAIYYNQPLW
jgi:hypothetical protein